MGETVVDSCCLINLFAVGSLHEWLPALGLSWRAPVAVMAETLYLRSWDEDGAPQKEHIDLQEEIDRGIIVPCDVASGEEMALYVQLASDLDDGEAMALAIASARSWLLATDDRRAMRSADDLGVGVVTTPELMQRWAGATGAEAQDIGAALLRIQRRARFVPSDDHPLHSWWRQHALSAGGWQET